MRFVPYLHAAFVRYHREGLPPFRPLVMDWPDDPKTWTVDDQYLMGESVLVAPMIAGRSQRDVYLPAGDWYDLWTREHIAGLQRISVTPPLDRVPIYVKSGTLLLTAEPAPHTEHPDAARLTATRFGPGPSRAVLFEEDGTAKPALTEVEVAWSDGAAGRLTRRGPAAAPRYEVIRWASV